MALDRNLSNRIYNGDIDAIFDGFLHDGQLYNVQSIISCVNHKLYNTAIEKQLNKYSHVTGDILGYQVSDFANAALVRLGGYKYSGDRQEVLILINTEKWFC